MSSALLSSLFLGIAWWYPDTIISALLTWPAAYFLARAVRTEHALRNLYLAGLILQPLGFFWLYGTISEFGNFSTIPALLIFGLFTVLSAVQYAFFAVIHRYLPDQLDELFLRAPIAWITAELVSIRIFPWHLGHTQIALTEFVQIADVIGSIGVSFLIMWIASSLVLARKDNWLLVVLTFAVAGGSVGHGIYRTWEYSPEFRDDKRSLLGEPFQVALIQGNVPLEMKHDKDSVMRNMQHYFSLSVPYDTPERIIVWPETVMLSWVYTGIRSTEKDPRLPHFDNASLLFGTLMFSDPETMYNSVISVRADGAIGTPYHKQVLMPFGEFTPFGETFPWLRRMNATAGNFTPGETPSVHQITFPNSERTAYLASLICYEDVVQNLAANAAVAGAEILVNHTNDAWFGDTVAPYQHHLIAAFRAIENKRYHLRNTNTGFTAIVDPLGRTVGSLPTYEEGVLDGEVYAVSEITWFSRYQNLIWWILSILAVLLSSLRMIGLQTTCRNPSRE